METAALTLNGDKGACKGVGGECVRGWVWVPSFVATTSPSREGICSEAAVTYHVNVSRAAQGSLENSPFLLPTHPIFQAEAAWSFCTTVKPRGGALLDEMGERVREKAWGR